MTFKIDTDLRNDILDSSVINRLGSGILNIYTGSQPSSPNDAASGTLLCAITISSGFNSAVGGSASLSSPPETGTASATGVAGWGRLVSGNYNIDGTIATSGGDFIINNVSIASGGTVNLVSATISMPES